MAKYAQTIDGQFMKAGGRPSGFDYLRISLSIAVTAYHTITVCYGRDADFHLWHAWNPLRAPLGFLIPSFFALSGFLVAGSLFRNTISGFLTLRGLRIFPALFCEVTISALIIGPALTTYGLGAYFSGKEFYSYFLNILGDIHYNLPGLFQNNTYPNIVNQQLWTIPYELRCYILLTLLSLFRVVQKPRLFVLAFCVVSFLTYADSAWLVGFDQERWGISGRLCMLSFLAGVLIYVWRDKIPYTLPFFLGSLLTAGLLLETMETEYFAAIPVAYATVWLGLQNPKKLFLIAGADYSYGVYLYGFVIQQAVIQLLPISHIWYLNLALSLAIAGGAAYLSWNFLEVKVLGTKVKAVAAVHSISARIERIMTALLPRRLFSLWAWLINIGDIMERYLLRMENFVRGSRDGT